MATEPRRKERSSAAETLFLLGFAVALLGVEYGVVFWLHWLGLVPTTLILIGVFVMVSAIVVAPGRRR
ncbi:MAG: hypothetical protein ACE5OY_04175 [Candidatus Bathyarchaeia archaeon]